MPCHAPFPLQLVCYSLGQQQLSDAHWAAGQLAVYMPVLSALGITGGQLGSQLEKMYKPDKGHNPPYAGKPISQITISAKLLVRAPAAAAAATAAARRRV